MAWIILLLSACLEAVWATALDASNGFREPLPTAIFLAAGILSMVGLSRAMKSIPVSVAYSVWTGLGAALTASYAMLTGAESAGLLKLLFLAGIVGCAAGLKLVDRPAAHPAPGTGSSRPPGTAP